MIALEHLSIVSGTFALERVDLLVPTGRYAVLMGKTGSGKTTLLEAICGLRRVTAGRIRLLARDVTGLKPAERDLGYVPQDRALFQTMTVWENLAFALRVRRWNKDRIAERVEELAALLGLTDLLLRRPHRLSGGEAQRVALGRALSFQPRVLLLDEPLAALDQETRIEMHTLLQTVRERTGVTTLHVTHDLEDTRRLADLVFQVRDGRIEETKI
ncbi:MAG: ATP-binding cassette domain-containing protein [Planctomycetes bacterium]|nr:ATP-binding cassette domain-containing protein [Planctomycetota bacterium]